MSSTARPAVASTVIDWAAAKRVGRMLAARTRTEPSYDSAGLQRQFSELVTQAEDLVAASTGLRSLQGPGRARVADRSQWVEANIASFQRLLSPTLDTFERRRVEKMAGGGVSIAHLGQRLGVLAPFQAANRMVAGAQLGAILAWMSTRVLGQYDLLLTDEPSADEDLVYFVGPNIVELEQRHGFESSEFRLWLALHEVTHRCQFTAVPWLRDHFLSLVDVGLAPLNADPGQFLEALRRVTEEIRSGRNPLAESGLIGLVATDEQLETIGALQALMSLLEGHGDVTMDRAGAAVIPGAERFSAVLRQRRRQVRGPQRFLQQLLGLEAKMRQYEEGEAFVYAVEAQGGPDRLNSVWRGPEWLPTLTEIRNPAAWLTRTASVT